MAQHSLNTNEVGERVAAYCRQSLGAHASKQLQALLDVSQATAERLLAGSISRENLEALGRHFGWPFFQFVLSPLCGPAPVDNTRRFWITEAGAQLAADGYGAFVRAALGTHHDSTDYETYALSGMGWVQAAANESVITVRLEERAVDPVCVRHAQAWLLTERANTIDIEIRRGETWLRQRHDSKHRAVQALDRYEALREARESLLASHWRVERKSLQAVTNLSHVRLLKAVGERGRKPGTLVSAIAELGLMPCSSIFMQRGADIITVHNGNNLGISPTEFVGRNVLDRSDQKYAGLVHAHVTAAAESVEPTFHELDVVINGERWPYQRVAAAEDINPKTGTRLIVTTTHLLRAKEAA